MYPFLMFYLPALITLATCRELLLAKRFMSSLFPVDSSLSIFQHSRSSHLSREEFNNSASRLHCVSAASLVFKAIFCLVSGLLLHAVPVVASILQKSSHSMSFSLWNWSFGLGSKF